MDIRITPSKLHGEVDIPKSKSICHRLLICNFVKKLQDCQSPEQITSQDICQGLEPRDLVATDVQATLNGLLAIANNENVINCHDSGSTARFLLPLVLVIGKKMIFKCDGRLKDRPFAPFIDELNRHGANITLLAGDDELFETGGKITADKFTLLGNVSSQFASGLAMALCALKGKSTIIVNPPIASLPYLTLTLKCIGQKDFYVQTVPGDISNFKPDFLTKGAIQIHVSGEDALLSNNSPYKDLEKSIFLEKDWSSAACWLAANYLGGDVQIKGINDASAQGDKIIKEILKDFDLQRILTIDCLHTPDLVPYLAIAAASREHPTVLEHIKRLEDKESNRVNAILATLKKINIASAVQETPDEKNLLVRGSKNFAANIPSSDTITFDSFGDHRIAMACAILANSLPCQSIITQGECVKKSYPTFWDDFIALGGKAKKI